MGDKKIYNWTDADDGLHSREDRIWLALLLVSGILAACWLAVKSIDDAGWL